MNTKLAYTLSELSEAVSISRSGLIRAINAGHLKKIKVGRRTLLPAESVAAWLDNLKAAQTIQPTT